MLFVAFFGKRQVQHLAKDDGLARCSAAGLRVGVLVCGVDVHHRFSRDQLDNKMEVVTGHQETSDQLAMGHCVSILNQDEEVQL